MNSPNNRVTTPKSCTESEYLNLTKLRTQGVNANEQDICTLTNSETHNKIHVLNIKGLQNEDKNGFHFAFDNKITNVINKQLNKRTKGMYQTCKIKFPERKTTFGGKNLVNHLYMVMWRGGKIKFQEIEIVYKKFKYICFAFKNNKILVVID